MPYSRNSQLPASVRNALPVAAQTIYRNAFNSVYEKTGSDARAARAGWAAVKHAGYTKKEGKWGKAQGFEPPQSGDLPSAGKKVLASVYSECRGKWVKAHPDDKENSANKESCSKQAWSAVKKAGYTKVDGKWRAQGFITTLTNMGEQVWQAKVSGKDVVYNSDMGTIRLCPKSYKSNLTSALRKPTTLNHTDKINGIIIDAVVDNDGDPVLKWQVDESTQEMMAREDWNGGISLSFYPTKLREDPEGVADWIAIEWEIDALGIGDGSERPACPTGLCNPEQVKGMVSENEAGSGGVATAEEIKAKQEALAAVKAKADAEAAAAAKAKEAAEAEESLKQLKAENTEDTMKVIETILKSKLDPLQKENEELKKKLDEISASDDAGKKFREQIQAEKKAALIKALPAESGIDYESKSLDELVMLKKLADKVKGETLPPPAGGQVNIPEPKSGAGAVTPEGYTVADIQEANRRVKNRYRKPQK